MSTVSRIRQLVTVAVGLLASRVLTAGEVCDDFDVERDAWTFRVPLCGPTLLVDDGTLHLTVPDFFTAGSAFDNWVGVDAAPTLERSDMGTGDWTITTRLAWDPILGPPLGNHHVGLMFAFGEGNDVVYWGEYLDDLTLAVERTGNNIRPTYPYLGSPVSLQVEKTGDDYAFRHRADDAIDAWTTETTQNFADSDPVSRVGLIIKTWGAAAPEVTADFDYFCLNVPDGDPSLGSDDDIRRLSPITNLICEEQGDEVAVSWQSCPGGSDDILVRVNGELVETLAPEVTSTQLSPPFPGGSILHIEVDNQSGFPVLSCIISSTISVDCDEFEEDPLQGGVWTLRTPLAGPAISVDDSPGFLRFTTPASAFDNWTGVDNAPSLERTDMGGADWELRTRLLWDPLLGAPVGEHHVGLMFAFGSTNDVVYWGQYGNDLTLRVERTGSAQTPQLAYDGAPVSLRVKKQGDTYGFFHRAEDLDPWIQDASSTLAANLAAPAAPVSRVGLIIKTWGGAPPAVTADFDYFCLDILDSPPLAVIDASPIEGNVPLEVNFSGSNSTDPSGGSLSYAWDYGDGMMGVGENSIHTYMQGGPTTVTLTVTDDDLNSGSATGTLYISDDVSPFAFTRMGDRGEPGYVTVDSTDPENPVYTIVAGGTTFANRSDQAHFLHLPANGDFVFTAQIVDADLFGGLSSRTGVMARADTSEGAATVLLSVDPPNDGYSFHSRDQNDVSLVRSSVTVDPPRSGFPVWLRLERQGATFVGSISPDGTSFTEYARIDIPVLNVGQLQVGVGAVAGRSGVTSRSVVSDLRLDQATGVVFRRGDADTNGGVNLTDAVAVFQGLFAGRVLTCADAADADDSSSLNLTDGIYILNALFRGSNDPPAPGPMNCGPDPTDDGLGCESYSAGC